jgi:hypothetical protein
MHCNIPVRFKLSSTPRIYPDSSEARLSPSEHWPSKSRPLPSLNFRLLLLMLSKQNNAGVQTSKRTNRIVSHGFLDQGKGMMMELNCHCLLV